MFVKTRASDRAKEKEETRNHIIEVTKKAFLEKGYRGVSMRDISNMSGIGLSNIYNYFKNKEEIFSCIVHPVLEAFNDMLSKHNEEPQLSVDFFSSQDLQYEFIRMTLSIVTQFREELQIILNSSQGSIFENFRQQLINRNKTIGIQYIEEMKKRYPELNTNVSSLLIELNSMNYVTVFDLIVENYNRPQKEIETFVSQYIQYGTAGWKEIMQVH
ncbi:Toluene efflux pump ttgABC operon repressor [Porphyromonas macacae]|uniref:Toluene efflux pump ttgABC operon repressor n=1 Tax=Porphyromonas macacae TaxID=28115 RepID=A0A379DFC4_9PORP|nr:Toluene efflux pump ttgABC operon repressor [Porphyromonas macacae]